MRFLVRLAALLAAVFGSILLSATGETEAPPAAPVKAWQDTINLPSYPEGVPPEDPSFNVIHPDKPVYPYTMRPHSDSPAGTQSWRVIHLENEFLACSVLPDLGGHLYRCLDKANGHDVFHPALALKKQSIAARGSWLSTGIEFNFPLSHSWDTISPVDFHYRQNADGSASVFVGDVDRVEGLQWLVELILRPGSRVLEQRVTLYNPGQIRKHYHWWANAAVTVESPETTFLFPTYLMYPDNGPDHVAPWPKSAEGIDLRRQGNSKGQLGLFTAYSKEPFMAIFNPASKTGVAHYADSALVPGKKLWNWGTDQDPWVRKNLSDNDTTYVELQAGVLPTNGDFDFLEPQQIKRFTEYWIPVHEMDGITRATPDAVLNLQRKDQWAVIQIQANREIGAAHIRVTAGSRVLLDEAASLTMGVVYSKTIPAVDATALSVDLLNSRGKSLLKHTEGVYDALKSAPPRPSGDIGCASKEGCLAEAAHNERIGALAWVRNSYEVTLRKFGNAPEAIKGLARLDVMQAHFESAIKRYQQISFGAEPLDAESEYYWGIALRYLGDQVRAHHHWSNALNDKTFAAPARLELAYDQVAQGHFDEALVELASLDALSQGLTRAGELEVIALRRAGQKAKTEERLHAWLATNPTNAVLRNEATLLGTDDPSLWLHLAAEPERVLNIVDIYLRAADYSAALSLLERTYPQVPANQMEPGAVLPQQNPLIVYYRGYCREMLGKSATADYAAASKLPVRYVFPSRFSSLFVLRSAIRANPADGTAYYLLGTLELQLQLLNAAIDDLRSSIRANFKEPVVFWNLSWGLADLHDPTSTLAALRDAEKLGRLPADLQKVSADLSRLPLPPGRRNASNAKAAPVATAIAPPAPPTIPKRETPPRPKVDPTALPPDELARYIFDELTDTEVDMAADALKQDRLTKISSSDLLRQAYYETKLQNALFIARKRDCDAIDSAVKAATVADPQRPFTQPGGRSVMASPRFLFYLGRVYGLCAKPQEAQGFWKQAAGEKRDITSSEYVFPLFSRVQLAAMNGKPVRPELEKALAQVTDALKSAPPNQLPALSYSAAMLLQALGRLNDSETLFRTASEGDALLAYTARLGLRDNELARHGVK